MGTEFNPHELLDWRMRKCRNLIALGVSLIFFECLAWTHQPIIAEGTKTVVQEPEISKGYYGKLFGKPHVYTIDSVGPFDLYVGILVPNSEAPKKDVTAEIRSGNQVLATIGGKGAQWKLFFEPFGQSTYWDGGKYSARLNTGRYEVIVSSVTNDSKYVLGIGEREHFGFKEILHALQVIPDLKRDFFGESPISFIKSPFGWGYVVAVYLLAFAFGFICRLAFRSFAKNTRSSVNRNIGNKDKMIRFGLALAVLLWAIATSWSLILIFISGFVLFEAVFGWSGIYAILGRSTCASTTKPPC